MATSRAHATPVLNYGVHTMPFFTVDGEAILVAIGNGGRERKRVRVRSEDDIGELEERLHRWLLQDDPPELHLKAI